MKLEESQEPRMDGESEAQGWREERGRMRVREHLTEVSAMRRVKGERKKECCTVRGC